jgi:hypothetical protein
MSWNGLTVDTETLLYIPESNHVSRIYSVAAVLYLQSVPHVMLFRPWNVLYCYVSTPCSVCTVQYGCFVQFLNFVLPRYDAQVLSEWFWNGSSRPYCYTFTFAFTFQMWWFYNTRSWYFKIFSAAFLITFLSPETATSINIHVSFI